MVGSQTLYAPVIIAALCPEGPARLMDQIGTCTSSAKNIEALLQ